MNKCCVSRLGQVKKRYATLKEAKAGLNKVTQKYPDVPQEFYQGNCGGYHLRKIRERPSDA